MQQADVIKYIEDVRASGEISDAIAKCAIELSAYTKYMRGYSSDVHVFGFTWRKGKSCYISCEIQDSGVSLYSHFETFSFLTETTLLQARANVHKQIELLELK